MSFNVSRNTVNQFVALAVFTCLAAYAYTNDLLLKPDPAVPYKGNRPRKGEGYFLFPTFPAVYVSADSRDGLQRVFESDRDALALTRKMAQTYLRHNTPPKATQKVFVDVASPYASWGLFGSAVGLNTNILQPRKSGPDRASDSVKFNRLHIMSQVSQRLLSGEPNVLQFNGSAQHWLRRVGTQGRDPVTTTVALEQFISSNKFPIFMVHVGVDAAILPSLLGIKRSIDDDHASHPAAVMLDVVTGESHSVAYELANSTRNEEVATLLAKTMDDLAVGGGYRIAVLDQPGCKLTKPATNSTLMGSTVHTLHSNDNIPELAKEIVSLAASRGERAVCRVLMYSASEFERTELPIVFIALVMLKVLCMAVICCRRRRKSESRSQ